MKAQLNAVDKYKDDVSDLAGGICFMKISYNEFPSFRKVIFQKS